MDGGTAVVAVATMKIVVAQDAILMGTMIVNALPIAECREMITHLSGLQPLQLNLRRAVDVVKMRENYHL